MLNGIGAIFMLHRTAPYEEGSIVHNENLKIAPDELDRIIDVLRSQRYSFVGLDELAEIIDRRKDTNGRVVAFTLDDGYKDNLEFGYPVFKTNNVPFCVYVTNSFPDKTTDLWWFALESLVMSNDSLLFPGDKVVQNQSAKQKAHNFLCLRTLVLQRHFRKPLEFFHTVGSFEFDLERQRAEKCLSWGDLGTLSKDPLVTIGCHTVNHLPLSKVGDQELTSEILISRHDLATRLNTEVDHFAFPFGSPAEASVREYQAAQSAGFKTITTTIHGNVRIGDDPHRLKRIFLTPDAGDKAMVKRALFWRIKSVIYGLQNAFR